MYSLTVYYLCFNIPDIPGAVVEYSVIPTFVSVSPSYKNLLLGPIS